MDSYQVGEECKFFYLLAIGQLLRVCAKTEIVSNSKLVPSVFIETHYWINHK